MATEKRLIDANALIDALPVVTEDRKITLYGAVADFMIMISAMPTVDAVEVVRCKECKHFVAPQGWPVCDCFYGLAFANADDFCSYGERRAPGS